MLPLRLSAIAATMFAAAIFGFFYAWICSTMWGLDAADPRIAIKAMRAMNASVRNIVFAPAFFGTPFALAAVALLAWVQGQGRAAIWFALGAVIYAVLGMGLTMAVNVPMNEALALVEVPDSNAAAAQIWADYSPRWQVWNITRTITSGVALCCALVGLSAIKQ